jgi:transcriptional regulator with XRE-family HTH domain
MKNARQEFARRLTKAMQDAGYEPRPAVLEREFNLHYFGKPMTLHGVRRWLLGETIPTHDKIIALAEWLRIPPEQLSFGLEINEAIAERRKRWDDGIGFQEREIIEAFLSLPVPQRRVLREVIEAFVKAYSAESTNAP